MRVFLTGGTGLVGSHCAELLRARGDDVRALVRRGSYRAHLAALGCELVEGDMTGRDHARDALASSMAGCDAVIHAAALVGQRASRDAYLDANVTGTAAILDAAAAADVRRAVHVSSVAVYGQLDGMITEDRWEERPIHPRAYYAGSKRAAEVEAWKHDEAAAMRITTVRPALIYGERDRPVARRLDRAVRLPVLPLPDGGSHVLPLVYAGNVASGIVRALDTPAAAGRAYNLAQDHATPLRDLLALWCDLRGRRVPLIPRVPGGVIEGSARVVDLLSGILPGVDLPGLMRPARLLRVDNPYDSSRARQELDWTPIPLAEALQRTAAWLERAGHT